MIENSYFWTTVFLLAIGTLGIRLSIIAVSNKIKITERHKELFSYIPSAILPAIIAPMVFFHNGQVAWAFYKERFLILILATGVCYFTRSTILTIAFGLAT